MFLPKLNKKILILILIFNCNSLFSANKYVVKILADNCSYNDMSNTTNVLTGFVWVEEGKVVGIVTALHGVCGCKRIIAKDNNGRTFRNISVIKADIKHDVALLSSSEIASKFQSGLEFSPANPSNLSYKELTMNSFAHGVSSPKETQGVLVRNPALESLNTGFVLTKFRRGLEIRNSPSVYIEVLSLQAAIPQGASGSPVTYQGKVVGVANGGLDGGRTGYCWAIPTKDIKFVSISSLGSSYDNLAGKNPNSLFILTCGLEGEKPVKARCSLSSFDEKYTMKPPQQPGIMKYNIPVLKPNGNRCIKLKIVARCGIIKPNQAGSFRIRLVDGNKTIKEWNPTMKVSVHFWEDFIYVVDDQNYDDLWVIIDEDSLVNCYTSDKSPDPMIPFIRVETTLEE